MKKVLFTLGLCVALANFPLAADTVPEIKKCEEKAITIEEKMQCFKDMEKARGEGRVEGQPSGGEGPKDTSRAQ